MEEASLVSGAIDLSDYRLADLDAVDRDVLARVLRSAHGEIAGPGDAVAAFGSSLMTPVSPDDPRRS